MTNPIDPTEPQDPLAPETPPELIDEAGQDAAFGNWPEVFGVVLTAFLVWLIFAFTG